MILIVCGGRDYRLTPPDVWRLSRLVEELGVVEVVHGAARGADSDAGLVAHNVGLRVTPFRADWNKYKLVGRKNPAGAIRNRKMAEYVRDNGGGACVAFPGGAGTADMVKVASELGLTVYDWRAR